MKIIILTRKFILEFNRKKQIGKINAVNIESNREIPSTPKGTIKKSTILEKESSLVITQLFIKQSLNENTN